MSSEFPASAGCANFEVSDPETGVTFPVVAMYPSRAPEQPGRLGPYTLDVAMNGPVLASALPLVVISHGSGGSHLVYRTLAQQLARNGFAVVMPEHPGNNRNNNDLAAKAVNLSNRPRHIRLVTDWAFSSTKLGAHLTPDAVMLIGHSLGGYTALALAGGLPTAFAHETPDQQARPLKVAPDHRVEALVLLAPAAAWFLTPGALSRVDVPILMLTAEIDPHTPAWHAEVIKKGVANPARVQHRVIPNAGHFSFLSPFPRAMVNPAFPPSQDPEGFDRETFLAEMNAEIVSFLQSVELKSTVAR